jgi:hypothetical protein
VDFLAAVFFMFDRQHLLFLREPAFAGTWLFLIGSILFAVRPTIRLLLELNLPTSRCRTSSGPMARLAEMNGSPMSRKLARTP